MGIAERGRTAFDYLLLAFCLALFAGSTIVGLPFLAVRAWDDRQWHSNQNQESVRNARSKEEAVNQYTQTVRLQGHSNSKPALLEMADGQIGVVIDDMVFGPFVNDCYGKRILLAVNLIERRQTTQFYMNVKSVVLPNNDRHALLLNSCRH